LLKSLRLPTNSEVIIQAFTCEAVILPILAINLKPIYVDIETETFSMNYNGLTNKLTNNSRVLILQHTFGLTPEFRREILILAQKHKLIVIEDLAHGFNPAIFKSTDYSLLSTNYFLLSFGRSKAFSSVFGGAVISTDNRVTDQLKNLQQPSSWFILRCLLYKPLAMIIKSTYEFYLGKILHRICNSFGLLIPEITEKEKAGNYDSSFNYAYPNALAILLYHQLKKFEQIQKNRTKIVNFYNQQLKNVTSYMLHVTDQPLLRYPLLVKNRNLTLIKTRAENIFLGTWYDNPVAPKGINLERVGYKLGSCPAAEEICNKIINLPTNVSEIEAEKIIKIFILSLSKD
ncbi:MAG: DegT/DnrJ/EryC1/StrS aminotransferase family protein, partial [Bacteroidetes bacterium]